MFEECNFRWKVPRSSNRSEVFPNKTSSFKWRLVNNSSFVELYSFEAPAGTIKVTCKFSIGNNFRIMNSEFSGKINNTAIMNIKLVNQSKGATENDTLLCENFSRQEIKVQIWAYLKFEDRKIAFDTRRKIMFDNHTTTILSSMLNNSNFCDLEIQTGSSSFKAHKSVFAEISPVFQAMLLNNMKEKQSSCIVIKDFECGIVEKMIHFIYHGDVEVTDYSLVIELLKISDVYDIQNLKCYCANLAKGMITDDNVIQIILQAELSNASDLKSYAIKYFVKNMRTYSQDEFKEIMEIRPNLLPEMLSKMSKHFCENQNSKLKSQNYPGLYGEYYSGDENEYDDDFCYDDD